MNSLKITAKKCVIPNFLEIDEVEFSDIKLKAEQVAKAMPSYPSEQIGDKRYSKEVVSIDYNEKEMTATINYNLIESQF